MMRRPHEQRPRLASGLALLACLAVLARTRAAAGAGTPPAIFIFGDSLITAGNNNYAVSLCKANYPPNGIDFVGHQPTGRYSNGRTVIDILGQEMGLGGFVPPYMASETTTAGSGDAVLRGVNYASGGAGILNQTNTTFCGRVSLDAQIDNYADSRQDLMARRGEVEAASLLRGALFSVTMGSNDLASNYLMPILSVPVRATTPPETIISAMIDKYRQQLTRLYSLDARKIVVMNVWPLGCIPSQRETNTACAEFPNQLAQAFNRRLRALVDELGAALPGSRFVYADLYRIFSDIIGNYRSHGFDAADSACCSVPGPLDRLLPCGPTSEYCTDRSKYVFWDPYHPTEAANALIARRILDGGPEYVSPVNVRQLLST